MKVLIPIAEEIEEMEAVILMDVLVRAGYQVEMLSVTGDRSINCSRGLQIKSAGQLRLNSKWDLILIPGGMPGAVNLAQSNTLKSVLENHVAEGKIYGAICAAPAVVLKPWGLLPQYTITSHPTFANAIENWKDIRVSFSENCITSQGPGTALEMALFVIETMSGKKLRQEVEAPLCMLRS